MTEEEIIVKALATPGGRELLKKIVEAAIDEGMNKVLEKAETLENKYEFLDMFFKLMGAKAHGDEWKESNNYEEK